MCMYFIRGNYSTVDQYSSFIVCFGFICKHRSIKKSTCIQEIFLFGELVSEIMIREKKIFQFDVEMNCLFLNRYHATPVSCCHIPGS